MEALISPFITIMNSTRLVLRGTSGTFNLDGGSMLPPGKFVVKPIFASVDITSADSLGYIQIRSSISAGAQVDSAQDGRLSFYLSPRFHGGGSNTDHYIMEHTQGETLGSSIDSYLTLEFLNPSGTAEAIDNFVLILDLIPVA
jgi:hypothetical protein